MGAQLLFFSGWLVVSSILLGVKVQAQTSSPSTNAGTLLAVKAAFVDNTRLASWQQGSDPCGTPAWEGVGCTAGVVTNLTLTRSCDGRTPPDVCSANQAWPRLVGPFPAAVTNLTGLQILDLGNNSISGPLPVQLGLLPLNTLILNSNNLNGTLPASLGGAVNMTVFLLDGNSFSGPLPTSFANLTSLQLVGLGKNQFSGPLPAFIFRSWTQMKYLNIIQNGFNDTLPPVGSLDQLFLLALSENKFTGAIPDGLGSLNGLNRLELANNKGLNGSIPSSFGATPSTLQYLDLSNNSLSGTIPDNLGNIVSLQQLLLGNNKLTGSIPASFANFTSNLQTLTLNSNNLTGPTSVLFNLCQGKQCYYGDNPLLGAPVPAPVAPSPPASPPPSSVVPVPAPAPAAANAPSESSSAPIAAILGAVGGGVAVLAVFGILFVCCRKRIFKEKGATNHSAAPDPFDKLPVAEPVQRSKAGGLAHGVEEFSFTELTHATNEWHSDNVIGEGGYGKVYKGGLHTKDGPQVVAIKRGGRQSQQGEREFLQEISAMSRIRHKHLVKLVGFCDAGAEQCLVYEYMVNGTVQDHLWGRLAADGVLDWPTRIQIALGAAKGLEYLHTAVEPPIIHRDVKLTNILLDGQLSAKVADFGISKLEEALEGATSVKGTLGYLDPYYVQFNELTIASDVYSFGMVLLEIVSARPVLGIGSDGKPRSLLQWALPFIQAKRSAEIADPRLDGKFNPASVHAFCALGLTCIRNTPAKRPTMAEIRVHLERIAKHALSRADESEASSDVTPYDLVSLDSLPPPPGPGSPLPEAWFRSQGSGSSEGPPLGFTGVGSTITKSSTGVHSFGSSYAPSQKSLDHSAAWEGPITTLHPR